MHELGSKDCRPKDHCYYHNEDEPITSTTFKFCGECFHVFPTIKDLVDAEEAMRADFNSHAGTIQKLPTSVFSTLEIKSCPFCSHDW